MATHLLLRVPFTRVLPIQNGTTRFAIVWFPTKQIKEAALAELPPAAIVADPSAEGFDIATVPDEFKKLDWPGVRRLWALLKLPVDAVYCFEGPQLVTEAYDEHPGPGPWGAGSRPAGSWVRQQGTTFYADLVFAGAGEIARKDAVKAAIPPARVVFDSAEDTWPDDMPEALRRFRNVNVTIVAPVEIGDA